MEYYKVILSHYCSCKVVIDNSENIEVLVKGYLDKQNRGEAKSDRIFLIRIRKIDDKEYNQSSWPSYQIKSKILRDDQ